MKTLSKEQRVRYARNISVSSIGIEGQQRLLDASVCVLGCGALGSVAASYLAGAGVGRITIVDFDTIDISNLQRQTHYATSQAGESKARTLAAHLRDLNPDVDIHVCETMVTHSNARDIFAGHDFIIDASDNPDTKYLTDEICAELQLPYSLAGVQSMHAQLMTCVPGSTRYSDIFPQSAGAGFTPCSIAGVLGPVAGIAACIQALEAIKHITGAGQLLTDKLLVADCKTGVFTTLNI